MRVTAWNDLRLNGARRSAVKTGIGRRLLHVLMIGSALGAGGFATAVVLAPNYLVVQQRLATLGWLPLMGILLGAPVVYLALSGYLCVLGWCAIRRDQRNHLWELLLLAQLDRCRVVIGKWRTILAQTFYVQIWAMMLYVSLMVVLIGNIAPKLMLRDYLFVAVIAGVLIALDTHLSIATGLLAAISSPPARVGLVALRLMMTLGLIAVLAIIILAVGHSQVYILIGCLMAIIYLLLISSCFGCTKEM